MIRTASRTSLRRGALGRSTRGVAPRLAQVTVTGKFANVEASADCGTSTLQVETTVAVTSRGADADCVSNCASASVGTPARTAVASNVRTITPPFYRRLGPILGVRSEIPEGDRSGLCAHHKWSCHFRAKL